MISSNKSLKVWKALVPEKIEDIVVRKSRYETRIKWHDKIFIASHGKLQKTRNAVAQFALKHAFGIEVMEKRDSGSIQTFMFKNPKFTAVEPIPTSSITNKNEALNKSSSNCKNIVTRVKNILKNISSSSIRDTYLQ